MGVNQLNILIKNKQNFDFINSVPVCVEGRGEVAGSVGDS